MIEIKNHGSAASWLVIIIVTGPCLATGYFVWNFKSRFDSKLHKMDTKARLKIEGKKEEVLDVQQNLFKTDEAALPEIKEEKDDEEASDSIKSLPLA